MSCSQSHARKKYKEFLKFHPGRNYYEWIVSRTLKRYRPKLIETIQLGNQLFRRLSENQS